MAISKSGRALKTQKMQLNKPLVAATSGPAHSKSWPKFNFATSKDFKRPLVSGKSYSTPLRIFAADLDLCH